MTEKHMDMADTTCEQSCRAASHQKVTVMHLMLQKIIK